MTALFDAARAVAEAREALIRRLHPWSSDPAEVDATTDALIAAVRRHDAEVVEAHAAQPPENVGGRFTSYINGWTDAHTEAADLIRPEEPTP